MLVYQAAIMTQLHHTSFFFVLLSLSLTINLPFTFGLSPSPPVASPEPVPLESTASQLLVPQSTFPIDNSFNASNADPYKCFKESPFAPNRPSYLDCLSAIRRLPEDPTPGSFQYVESVNLATTNPHPTNGNSTGRPLNAFKLPRSETFLSCRLIIGLDASSGGSEEGSWASVGLNAGQLNLQCVHYGSLKEFYGGSTTAGDNGLITIVLLYSGSGLGDNDTAIASS